MQNERVNTSTMTSDKVAPFVAGVRVLNGDSAVPENETGPQDIYVDQVRMTTTPYGVNVTFGLAEPHPSTAAAPTAEDKVRLRMSHEYAKIVAMMLRRQLKAYEDRLGSIIALLTSPFARS